MRSLSEIQLDLEPIVSKHNIKFIQAPVTAIDPQAKKISLPDRTIEYDYAIVATGPELALDAFPGLGPEGGYTQSVCTPHHALLCAEAWEKFIADPGPIVVGTTPGASCFGPAYEFALLMQHSLKQRGLLARAPITFVTSEPYAGHLGIGGMANSRWLIRKLMAEREIELLENVAVSHFEPETVHLADGRTLPFKFAMFLPPFRGQKFLRETPGLTDAKGMIPVLPTYRHPDFPSIYVVGVATQLKPAEITPIPTGVPKVGLMSEEMALAIAHNIAVELGVKSADRVQPTLQAVCFADFGDTGALFLADPLLPDAAGNRRRALTMKGVWVSWIKTIFEKYFLFKMRRGWTIPWFERWGFSAIGLPLVEPIATEVRVKEQSASI
jgi:sulfide:quinone oxidoreductase